MAWADSDSEDVQVQGNAMPRRATRPPWPYNSGAFIRLMCAGMLSARWMDLLQVWHETGLGSPCSLLWCFKLYSSRLLFRTVRRPATKNPPSHLLGSTRTGPIPNR